MSVDENIHFVDKVVDTLRKAAVELEELQVKSALGKSEARDAFEVAKKKFNMFMHESRSQIKAGSEKVDEIHQKIDELIVQLALGKAETLDEFKAQKKNLLMKIHDLEVKIKTNEKLQKIYAFVLIELDKFKVQMEAFEKKYEDRSESFKGSYEKGKQEFNQFVDGIKSKYGKKEETSWEHFQNEVSEAFDHLKSAFSKS